MSPAPPFLAAQVQPFWGWLSDRTQNWDRDINLSALSATQIGEIVAVVLLLAAAIALDIAMLRRRTQKLRTRFGPTEYERTVKEAGSRRRAESVLRERARRVEALHIRPLAPADSARFVESWDRVQARFVDSPGGAVSDADKLLGDVLSTRGYPLSEFEQRAADISVDHSRVLENYRAAHRGALRHSEGHASTEDLRQAMIHYRTLFEELVGEPELTRP